MVVGVVVVGGQVVYHDVAVVVGSVAVETCATLRKWKWWLLTAPLEVCMFQEGT